MEKFIVDRISGDIAVLEKEDLSHIEVRLSDIPFEIKEGSVIAFDGKDYSLDLNEEAERRNRILEKQRKIFKNK